MMTTEGRLAEAPVRSPLALHIVALLFISSGAMALLDMVLSALYDHFTLNIGVLGLVLGPGIWLRSRWIWLSALWLLRITIVSAGVGMVLVPFLSGPFRFRHFGSILETDSKGVIAALVVLVLGVAVWQYRVLTRADVRRVFGEG